MLLRLLQPFDRLPTIVTATSILTPDRNSGQTFDNVTISINAPNLFKRVDEKGFGGTEEVNVVEI